MASWWNTAEPKHEGTDELDVDHPKHEGADELDVVEPQKKKQKREHGQQAEA